MPQENQVKNTSMLKPNLPKSPVQQDIDSSGLSPFQRIMLANDGTLTGVLESYLFEKMHVVKLSEDVLSLGINIPALEINAGQQVIERKILLQGKNTRKNWIYASSIIVPDRLESKFREELLNSSKPIGRIWVEHKMETFKEIIDSQKQEAGDLAEYFEIAREDILLSRTYRVYSNRKPIMLITEKFPSLYFGSCRIEKNDDGR